MAGHPARNLSVRCAASQSGRTTYEISRRSSPTAITSATSITAKFPSLHSNFIRWHHDNPPTLQNIHLRLVRELIEVARSGTALMLQIQKGNDLAVTAQGRIATLDRARTVITLLVVLHHSIINYTHFGHGDRMRWLGFDLVVLFNDSFFMACMFFISGLFVRGSLVRRRSANFLGRRTLRLGVPLFFSIFILMPVAYYPTFLPYHLPGTTDFTFLHFWWHMLTIGPWPSGSAWFLWVLLVLDAIAALLWAVAHRVIEAFGQLIYALRDRPMTAFLGFLVFSIIIYLPIRLIFCGSSLLRPRHVPT